MQKRLFGKIHFFSLLVMILTFALQGCDDKKTNATLISVENTTEIITPKDKSAQETSKTYTNQEDGKSSIISPDTFYFAEEEEKYTISIHGKKLSLLNNKKSIILLNIFKSHCSPCMSQVKSLKLLEKKYHQLRIVNIFEKKNKNFTRFHTAITHAVSVMDSKTLPLSILYVNGAYYTHFEGQTPIEMFTHDIQTIIKQQRY